MKTVAQRSVVIPSFTSTTRVVPSRPRTRPQIQCQKDDVSNVAAGLVMSSASLLVSQPVQAAQEFATVAASDNRLGAVAFIFVPAIAWVLFNISGPATRQLDAMNAAVSKPSGPVRKSVGRKPPPKKAPVKKAPAKRPPPKKAPAKRR